MPRDEQRALLLGFLEWLQEAYRDDPALVWTVEHPYAEAENFLEWWFRHQPSQLPDGSTLDSGYPQEKHT